MLGDHERKMLEQLESALLVDDPAFARKFSKGTPWKRYVLLLLVSMVLIVAAVLTDLWFLAPIGYLLGIFAGFRLYPTLRLFLTTRPRK